MVALGGVRTNNPKVFTCLRGEINQHETGEKKKCCHRKQQGGMAWITLEALGTYFHFSQKTSIRGPQNG